MVNYNLLYKSRMVDETSWIVFDQLWVALLALLGH